MLDLADVVQRTPKFWRTLGNKCVRLLKAYAAQGLDFNGDAFPAYSDSYAKQKGGARPKGKRNPGAKAAGTGKRQSSRQTSPPNLQLTGDMLRDLKTLDVTSADCTIGWSVLGDRLQWNADMGRALVNLDSADTVHPQLDEEVESAIALDTEEKLEKWAKEPLVIHVKR